MCFYSPSHEDLKQRTKDMETVREDSNSGCKATTDKAEGAKLHSIIPCKCYICTLFCLAPLFVTIPNQSRFLFAILFTFLVD